MENCKNEFILLKGYSSRWNNVDWLGITFKGKMDLTGFSAKFKIGDYVFNNNDLLSEWIINLTDEQTGTLPLGLNTASLIVYDRLGEGKPFSTAIPVLVKNWVDGVVKIEKYKADINVTLNNQNQLVVNVETPDTGLTSITGYDPNKIQTLKNMNGTLTWVDD